VDIASLLIGRAVGALASWIISAHFYARSNADLQTTIDDHRRRQDKKDTLASFELMLTQGTWRHEYLDDQPTWICDQRASLKIVKGEATEPFDEEWTRLYPDKSAKRCDVHLRINDSTIKSLIFVHLDGHRIVVTMPRRVVLGSKPLYFWEKDSLEFKVGRIIGEYYIHESIENVAKISDVAILSGQSRA
jgi:hypothetical protein